MARGKVKYRDVVGKGQEKNRRKQKNKQRPRKTLSLYKNETNKRKRKYNNNFFDQVNIKKQKLEENTPETEMSSENDTESEDDMKKLLNTFGGQLKNKTSVAIDSSSSSSESETEEENGENKSVIEMESKNDNTKKLLNAVAKQLKNKSSISNSDSSSDSETVDEYIENKSVIEDHDSDTFTNSDNENTIGELQAITKQNETQRKDQTFESENDSFTKENEIHIETLKEENDVENLNDPFIKHLSNELHDSLLESIQSNPVSVDVYTEFWPNLGKLGIQIPKCEEIANKPNVDFSISEKTVYADPGQIPKKLDFKSNKLHDLYIKTQIINNLSKLNKCMGDLKDLFTPLQAEVFSIINNYQDLYYPGRSFDNADEIRYVYCLHVVNHILKTRIKVIHHNARLTKKDEVPEEFRDQGLVRPKVIIIVPFKDAAYKIICNIIDILLPQDKGNVMNKKRFIEDYTGNELSFPKKNPKPEDYVKTFQGNTSDDFKIGLTVTKKTIKLYADFYSSDIIVASPLGLRTIIGAEGEQDRDYDFLASIELLILDQTEIFFMQNWDHIVHILNHMHLQPKDSHGTDFSRVRTWSLNGWAKYYRQTLIFSSLVLPEINAVFNKKCLNYAGKVRVINPIEFGCIRQVLVQLPHVFHKFDAQNAAQAIDSRFEFFVNKILPPQKESLMKQTLIFIPNYFDYVRVRNYFKREDIGFVQICEYSKEAKIARARDMFYHGDAHFLLYTERFHFFNRKRIKGIRQLIFYQPPTIPHFYYEMCNLMQEANMNRKVGNISNMTVTVIYSKYDVHQLSAIVSTERAAKMIHSERKVHMMVTEN